MERLFHKKKIAILVIAALVVLVFLFCMLMIFLTQLSSLNSTKERLEKLCTQAQTDAEAMQRLVEYRQTDKYVIDWAISMHYIPDWVINFIHTEVDK